MRAIEDALERRRAEQALRESESRYRNIVETAEEGIWTIDAEGRTTFVNRKMAEMLDYTIEEMIGKSLLEFMDDEGRQITAQNMARRREGIAEQHEFRFLRKNGSSIWTLLNTTPLHDERGYAGALAMVTDITARKRAEENLLQIARGVSATTGEDFFVSLVSHLIRTLGADIAFVAELTPGNVDRVQTLAVQVGSARVENFEYHLKGTPCEKVVGRETCSYPNSIQSLFPDDQMLVEMSVEAYVGTPLFTRSGQALGLLAVLFRRPVDDDRAIRSALEIFAARASAERERLHAEQALRASEAMLNKAQEVSNTGSWTWDIASNAVTWSRQTYRLYGADPDQPPADLWAWIEGCVHPDDKAALRASISLAATLQFGLF